MISKINEITPIKDGMSKEEAEDAIKSFLSEILSSDKLIKQEDILSIETTSDESGFRTFRVIKLKDDSTWVLGAGGIERIIGAHYLDKQLIELNSQWKAVETRFALLDETKKNMTIVIAKSNQVPLEGIPTIMSDDVVTFSKYVGSKKPDTSALSDEGYDRYTKKTKITENTGYSDFTCSANLRLQDDGKTIIIIDTEYGSFTNDNGSLLSDESEAFLGGSEFDFPVVDILGEDIFNNHDGIEDLI